MEWVVIRRPDTGRYLKTDASVWLFFLVEAKRNLEWVEDIKDAQIWLDIDARLVVGVLPEEHGIEAEMVPVEDLCHQAR